jgi:hypothetical protein
MFSATQQPEGDREARRLFGLLLVRRAELELESQLEELELTQVERVQPFDSVQSCPTEHHFGWPPLRSGP